MTSHTVFDDVFRTAITKMPDLAIPLINEAFGRDYPLDEPLEQYRNEYQTPKGKVITDSIFKVRGLVYHIECQSTHDERMAIRMIEYDFAIALDQAINGNSPHRVRFPESCVLYLRNTPSNAKALQIELEFPNGEMVNYEPRVMLAQSFTSNDLFAKHLLLLFPFYIMRYERDVSRIADSSDRTSRLLSECEALRSQLEGEAVRQDRVSLYEQLVELAVAVSDHVLSTQEALRKKVRSTMGGEILELMSDRIAKAEQEAREMGLSEGLAEGRAKGREEGRAEGREEGRAEGRELGLEEGLKQGKEDACEAIAEKLRAMGLDEESIRQATSI